MRWRVGVFNSPLLLPRDLLCTRCLPHLSRPPFPGLCMARVALCTLVALAALAASVSATWPGFSFCRKIPMHKFPFNQTANDSRSLQPSPPSRPREMTAASPVSSPSSSAASRTPPASQTTSASSGAPPPQTTIVTAALASALVCTMPSHLVAIDSSTYLCFLFHSRPIR